ncbi:MAG: hypothetical protein ACKV19_25700 [Verrucomicrobiales bacterium]
MSHSDLIPKPVTRKLRIYAFDPSVSAQFDTAGIGEITLHVPWDDTLTEGPVDEYLEVVDADPASGVFYNPVNLNDPHILAQDGLPPSESNPQFHQQMVYAVARTTIWHFERALGRVALWSSHGSFESRAGYQEQFVQRLRIYPHALRDRNAYYSPEKKALLFGYFPVGIKSQHNSPGTLVFTCLAHDIIAHETTHALLDGVHPRFNEPMNMDVLAFHEAFADIVALFQHFSYRGVLRDQIMRTRGNLAAEHLLGQLAQQFGKASGRGDALRNYLGKHVDGKWVPQEPDVRALEQTHEPHGRGAILVAAVFGAFLKMYRTRTVDLYRIASEGTGVLREGDIHPDLAGRLAVEAERCAQYTLQMCIRAIDYCPPVGITFGDYLRAIITADIDINPDDEYRYRVAFVESFRQWGIHSRGVNATGAESLLWPAGPVLDGLSDYLFKADLLEDQAKNYREVPQDDAEEEAAGPLPPAGAGKPRSVGFHRWDLESDRFETWKGMEVNAKRFWWWLYSDSGRRLAKTLGLIIGETDLNKGQKLPSTVYRLRESSDKAAVEVHSVRWAVRRTSHGGTTMDMVVELTQRRRGYFDANEQKLHDAAPTSSRRARKDFTYRAGCTLIIDPSKMEIRRLIRTPGDIADDSQLENMRQYYTKGIEAGNAFDMPRYIDQAREPFALLHHHE